MTVFTEYKPGTFSWVDLATTDGAAAKAFYGKLFGWSFVDMPAGPENVYSMCQINGNNAAGLYQQSEQQQGMPPYWASYVSVNDVEAVAAKTTAAGGSIVVEPMDVMESGRMVLIQDPTGAMVAAWQPKQHIGADVCNEPGALSWNELLTHDVNKAKEFYTTVFDWGHRVDNMGDFDYHSFSVGDRMNAGMMQITEQMGDVPPYWGVYFAVEDCDASAAKAVELGGNVLMQPMDLGGVGRMALLQDPQGAVFHIITLNNPQ